MASTRGEENAGSGNRDMKRAEAPKRLRLCIIVPVFNEGAVLRNNLETILREAEKLPVDSMVVAVDDGSKDDSPEILRTLSARYSHSMFRTLLLPLNRGYGAACRQGASFAIANDFDYALFMDSDLTDDPKYLGEFVARMQAGWDYIKTTRHIPEGGYRDVPLKRRIISTAGCLLTRVASGLPLTDLANGFRAVKVDVLRKMELTEDNFGLILEELMKARRFTNRFCEFPRVQGVRTEDARASAFRYDLKTLWGYFRYLFLA